MKIANWLLAVSGCVASATIATPAAAIQYFLNIPIGAGSVSGSITTDNTLGVLTTANVTHFSLLLDDSAGTLLINNGNAAASIVGSALTATSTGLFFNFSGGGLQYALFQSPAIGSGSRFACVQTSGCFDFNGAGAAVDVNSAYPGQVLRLIGAGIQQVAVAPPPPPPPAPVPEPATWGMMLVGFGAIGQAMRRRQKAAVSFS